MKQYSAGPVADHRRKSKQLTLDSKAMTFETHLVTKPATLQVCGQGPATGAIWLVTAGCEFPMAGWDDFVIVILGWWSAAILRLWSDKSVSERVHFMDGPYAVEISKMESRRLQLRMLADPGGEREVAVGEADIRRFVSGLTTQARKLLDECKSRQWWSPDEQCLASHLDDLNHELGVLPF